MVRWPVSNEARQRNSVIELELKRAKIAMESEIKMLLLGAGESGKTTLRKQLRLVYKETWSQSERENQREFVWYNLLDSARSICEGFEKLNIVPSPDIIPVTQTLLAKDLVASLNSDGISPGSVDLLKALWNDASTQVLMQSSNKVQISDSASYFFKAIDRISSGSFVPTDEDILRIRVRTTGIVEERFDLPTKNVLVCVDVGGQRSERKKWIHCFENVSVLMFVAAISEYDQVLYEDSQVNRFEEALTLFGAVFKSRWFTKSSFILILNKLDRFTEKIATSPLSDYFPDYTGTTLREAKYFIESQFRKLETVQHRKLYSFFSTATDCAQSKFVIGAVVDMMMQKGLSEIKII